MSKQIAKGKTGSRIAFISFLQFVGVISVIFGHSMNSISVPTILTEIKAWVYTYHMPLFFFVSAFLFSYKGGYDRGYKNVLTKRFSRLIVPYLLWNAVFIIPKVLFKNYIYDEVSFSAEYFIRIILRPRDNILGHTWFLCALFEMFILAILFDKAKKHKTLWIPISLALIVVNCFGVEDRWLAIGDLMKNGIFFWCGLMLGTVKAERIEKCLNDSKFVISVLTITIGTSIVWIINKDMQINTLVLGMSALALFMILQKKFNFGGGLIEFVSRNSFPIYIMHWPVIMVLRLVFYQKIGIPAVAAMTINLTLGFTIPCVITLILRKINIAWCKKVCAVVFGM